MNNILEKYIAYYNNFSKETVDSLLDLVTEDVHFKDPFNELRSAKGMLAAMRDVFETANEPRFVVLDSLADNKHCYIKWDFYFRPKKIKTKEPWHVRGLSELKFSEDGRIASHIDYWDAAEGFYEKVPVLGGLMRFVKKRMKIKKV